MAGPWGGGGPDTEDEERTKVGPAARRLLCAARRAVFHPFASPPNQRESPLCFFLTPPPHKRRALFLPDARCSLLRGAWRAGRDGFAGGAPQQQGWMPPAPAYSGPSWNPSSGGGFYEGDVGVNGYEGSDAPDDGGYEGYDDVDNLLAEAIDLEAETALKDTWVASARNCTCCKGFIYACSGQTCVLLGVCFCTAGELLDQEQQQAAEAALADAASQDGGAPPVGADSAKDQAAHSSNSS